VVESLLTRGGPLLTTEKDWINLGASAPAGIYWLKIKVELDNEPGFLNAIAVSS
jgi:hypothetical protein